MSAYWSSIGGPSNSRENARPKTPNTPPQSRLRASKEGSMTKLRPTGKRTLQSAKSMNDINSRFQKQSLNSESKGLSPPPSNDSTHRKGKSVNLRGFQELVTGRRPASSRPGSYSGPTSPPPLPHSPASSARRPNHLKPSPLPVQRSVSQHGSRDPDYLMLYSLANSPTFPDSEFGASTPSPRNSREIPTASNSQSRSADNTPLSRPIDRAPKTASSSAHFDDAIDMSLFVAATAGFSPLSPTEARHQPVGTSLVSPIVEPPTPLDVSPLTPAPLTPRSPRHSNTFPVTRARRASPSADAPMPLRPNSGSSSYYTQVRTPSHISTPQTRAAEARAAMTPSAAFAESLDDIQGDDDELPDYATSQAQAHAQQRAEASRRARELEARWANSQMR